MIYVLRELVFLKKPFNRDYGGLVVNTLFIASK